MSNPWKNPWAKHYQQEWQARAGNPRLPLWLRVASLAYGTHLGNGHANFHPGEIAVALTTVDTTTGLMHSPKRQDINRAIKAAVSHDWLAERSGSTCLVVPGHAISGGLGNPAAPCPVHENEAAKRRRQAA
jgi:hypothetical protein